MGDEVRERIRLYLKSRLASTHDGPIELTGSGMGDSASCLTTCYCRVARESIRRYYRLHHALGRSDSIGSRWSFVLAALVLAWPAGATETRDQVVLDSVVKDLGISLLSKPENTMLRLPLAPGNWSLFGRLKPYASLGPRVYTQAEEPTALAVPLREADRLRQGHRRGRGVELASH